MTIDDIDRYKELIQNDEYNKLVDFRDQELCDDKRSPHSRLPFAIMKSMSLGESFVTNQCFTPSMSIIHNK